jgi:hypothetical protein
MVVPAMLEGRELRRTIKYRDLSCHLLTVDERTWICRKILEDNADKPKRSGNFSNRTVETLEFIANRYNLNQETIRKWLEQFQNDNLESCTKILWINHVGWPGPPATL